MEYNQRMGRVQHFAAACIACCACGRLNFDPLEPPEPPVDLDTPFGPAVVLTSLNSLDEEDDVSLTDDLLEIYFASQRTGTAQIFRATRTSLDEPFGVPEPVVELNAGGINNPRITPDGLAIVFASERAPNAGDKDLWMAKRSSRGAMWDPPQRLDDIASVDAEFEPWLTASRLAIYFSVADRDGGDIAVVRRATEREPFSARVTIGEISVTPEYDGGVWIDESELVALFHSGRAGPLKMFQASRASIDEPFGTPVLVPGLGITDAREQDPWMSSDRRTLVFASDAAGSFDLYLTTR